MEIDSFKGFKRPRWTADASIEGRDISAEVKRLMRHEHGTTLLHDFIRDLQDEYIFLRLDITELPTLDGAKFLKAFAERSAWPRKQEKIVVLVCSVEERLRHRYLLDNIFESKVRWQLREVV